MSDEFRHVFLPYCLDKQPDGRYAVLNRRYKPVGMTTTTWVRYEEHPCLVKLPKLTEAIRERLSAPGSHLDATRVYLYNDGCEPTSNAQHWKAYQARLQLLAELQIEI